MLELCVCVLWKMIYSWYSKSNWT